MDTAPCQESPPSRRTSIKIVATVLVAVGAVSALMLSSTRADLQFYKHVDEVMAAPGALRGKALQVHGYVVKDSIENRAGTLEYRFRLETKAPRSAAEVTAYYKGIVPDTFKSGAEVVVTGTLADDNRLLGTAISAKCPSKYEAKTDYGEAALPAAGAPAKPAQL
jgi:cytochrome c-type biogenesis protein CcmE